MKSSLNFRTGPEYLWDLVEVLRGLYLVLEEAFPSGAPQSCVVIREAAAVKDVLSEQNWLNDKTERRQLSLLRLNVRKLTKIGMLHVLGARPGALNT